MWLDEAGGLEGREEEEGKMILMLAGLVGKTNPVLLVSSSGCLLGSLDSGQSQCI